MLRTDDDFMDAHLARPLAERKAETEAKAPRVCVIMTVADPNLNLRIHKYAFLPNATPTALMQSARLYMTPPLTNQAALTLCARQPRVPYSRGRRCRWLPTTTILCMSEPLSQLQQTLAGEDGVLYVQVLRENVFG
jgi:hypothetical protein